MVFRVFFFTFFYGFAYSSHIFPPPKTCNTSKLEEMISVSSRYLQTPRLLALAVSRGQKPRPHRGQKLPKIDVSSGYHVCLVFWWFSAKSFNQKEGINEGISRKAPGSSWESPRKDPPHRGFIGASWGLPSRVT